MKLFLILASTLFILHNQASAGWVQTKQVEEKAKTQNQVQDLIDKYEIEISENEKINYLEYSAKFYSWNGESSCDPNDPRLKYKSETISTKTINPDGSSGVNMITDAHKIDADPCYTPPVDGHWVLRKRDFKEYRSERELEDYLNERREQLPNTKANELEYASQDLYYYEWDGNTSCSANDPRLEHIVDEGEMRFKEAIGQSTSGFGFDRESTVDPCKG